MKKLLKVTCLLLALTAVLFTGCKKGGGGTDEPDSALAEKGEIMAYTQYNPDAWLKPVWNTREVYNETVLFVGENDSAKLLYEPAQIISVRDYQLGTEYVAGVDYEIEDGKIKRLGGSRIPYFEVDEYFRLEPDSVAVGVFGRPQGFKFKEKRYFKYGEGSTFTSKQIAVTYTHNSPYTGEVPLNKSGRLARFLAKVKAGQSVNAVFYGDSITVGCNASGTEYGGNIPPYTPSFDQMVCSRLAAKYGAQINVINTAVGGMNTEWGLNNADERLISKSPDLAVIAFGMNDPSLSIKDYKNYITQIIDALHTSSPDCDVILVSTTVPNNESDWYGGNQKLYVTALREIENDPKYNFVALADMTAMHLSLLKTKRFRDMTGNNVNHPNDFLIRVYAQVILATLGE